MDNWGDPWADNANDTKSPTKPTVTSPLPPSFSHAPAVLNGFWDDAGWGNDDTTELHRADFPLPSQAGEGDLEARDDALEAAVDRDSDLSNPTAVATSERVVSEPSDTSTPVQLEDDGSPQSSTSPSELSHIDVAVESPRTSYEEDRAAAKADIAPQSALQGFVSVERNKDETETAKLDSDLSSELDDNDILGNESDTADRTSSSVPADNLKASDSSHSIRTSAGDTAPQKPARFGTYAIDPSLLSEFLPSSAKVQNFDEAPDDPIHSTSTRKAWYRLTRKQTLREFNNGSDHDNYVRVTWANSNVRNEVNKIVARWAREDRLSGTGPGARASFYWDTPAPAMPKGPSMHNRHQTVTAAVPAITKFAPSNRQSLPLPSTHVPPAFNWSSSAASVDPGQQLSPSLPSTTSPTMVKSPLGTQVHQQGKTSLDLPSHQVNPPPKSVTPLQAPTTPAMATSSIKDMTSTTQDVFSSLESHDSLGPSEPGSSVAAADEDAEDEWGDMISSEPLTTPITAQSPPAGWIQIDSSSRSTSMPQTNTSHPFQSQWPETTNASPIVRLKSTVSPTSALFKANAFMPLSAEQGPIGPHILKPTNRSASSSSQKPRIEHSSTGAAPASTPNKGNVEPSPAHREDFPLSSEVHPAVTSDMNSISETHPVNTVPGGAATSNQSHDPWANADFSFFEPAAPPAPSGLHAEQKPPSLFSTRTDIASSHGRSSLDTLAAPLKSQPVSIAQQQRRDVDQAIQDILRGLPDLSYMLR